MLILLSILLPLALFGFLHNRQTTRKLRIQNALEARDDKTALREIRLLEERFSYYASSNRFSAFVFIGTSQGYSCEKPRCH
ncbi:MAG: hypothetical protein ACK57P_19935, partial [Planctomycetota bacterium]